MTLVAGVDSSTQSCKVRILDATTGREVRSGSAPHPEGTEVAPEHWWAALRTALAEAGGLGDVAALSVAGQQHGLVLLAADGRVLREALLWNDTRSADAARALVAEVGAAELARRCGSVPVASLTSTKLRWVRDHEPDVAAQVAAVALPHDWLSWRLRGYGPAGESPLGPELDRLCTDRSDASGTGYWSPGTQGYDLELFALAFGRPAREAGETGLGDPAVIVLPRVLAPDAVAGSVHPSLSAGATVLVGAGAGDNAAGALGLGAELGDVVVSVGTSGTVCAIAARPACDPQGVIAGFADASGAFLPITVTLNAARILGSTAALLDVDFEGLAALALAAAPGSEGVVLLPYFEGERTPNLPEATASLHGLSMLSTTRPNVARAAIEGMLCSLAYGLTAITEAGTPAHRILLIGGAVQNPAVREIAGEVFAARVEVPTPGEYVARGAAVQAAWCLRGVRPHWELTGVQRPASTHQPAIFARYRAVAGL